MILVWQEGGDDGYAADMHAQGFDHLALRAERLTDMGDWTVYPEENP